MLVTRETPSGHPPPAPTTGQETEPSVSSRTGSHNGQQESAAELRLTQRDGAAAGTWTMKYSQKLQPGSVLFSLRVLMSSSNLPRFLVKDISSNVLSLVKKAFQDS